MTVRRERIPLTILSGFLGAGKTTLLNRLLCAPKGRRLGVIVNDFGSLHIDADLIAASDAKAIHMANGCICCTMGDSLMRTLATLRASEDPPDHLVIEASGVSDPWSIAQIGLAGDAFVLDGVIALADAELVRVHAEDSYVGDIVRRQLTAADIIVLNKRDLVDAATLHRQRRWLDTLVPDARIVEASHAAVATELVLGIGAGRAAPRVAEADGDERDHLADVRTWSFSAVQPLSTSTLQQWLAALPPDVLRAKGILHTREAPGRRMVFHRVGGRWSLIPGGDWAGDVPASRLVLLATGDRFDGGAWLARFRDAVLPQVRPA